MTKAVFIKKKKKSNSLWAILKVSKVAFLNKEMKTFTKKKIVFKIHTAVTLSEHARECLGMSF